MAGGQQRKELKADDLGFLYAALAGFRVERLLRVTARQQILTFWIDQVGAGTDDKLAAPSLRIELLQQRLAERLQSTQAFQFGVRLLHFGRYSEALDLLREFQLQFPSREVFNNLGYGHLHRAIDRLAPAFAYHYWLPGVSDLHTPLTRLAVRAAAPSQERSQWRIPPAARQDLLDAARYFDLAISKDSRYVPAHVNLAVTHCYSGWQAVRAKRKGAAVRICCRRNSPSPRRRRSRKRCTRARTCRNRSGREGAPC